MTAGLMRKLAALLLSMLMTSVWAGSAATNEKVASIDGERIAYEVRGKGDLAIVLVHGWSCDRSYFQHQLESFSDRYIVVTPDLAGHGESTLGRENYTIALFGADVAAVVRKLDLKRVVLVGHSMGGDVVVAAARLLKGRVGDRLTLVGVGGITTCDDACARIDAGATLVQGYTAFVYEGPLWPARIVRGLASSGRPS